MSIYDRIENLLANRFIDNPITSAQICKALSIIDSTAWPKTRALILQTMVAKGIPIGATRKGYFIIANKKQLKQYTETLEKRANNILWRKNLVKGCFKIKKRRSKNG